jgi:hypothetical protein
MRRQWLGDATETRSAHSLQQKLSRMWLICLAAEMVHAWSVQQNNP